MNRKAQEMIEAYIRNIRRLAAGARMHYYGAKRDLMLFANAENMKESLSRRDESEYWYHKNIDEIKAAIDDIKNPDSAISHLVPDREAFLEGAIKAAGVFYGDAIPAFPQLHGKDNVAQ